MSVSTLNNNYGSHAYATAAEYGKTDQNVSGAKEKEVTEPRASDTVELSQTARDQVKSPKVDDVLDEHFNPPVPADELENEIAIAKKKFMEMVEAAKAKSGVNDVNINSNVVGGKLVTFSVMMESGCTPEMTKLKNGTYAAMDFVPDFIKGYAGQDSNALNADSQATTVYHNEMKSDNYTDKFQRLAVLNAVSYMSENNESFKSLYQNNPLDALSQYRWEITDLTQRFSLNHNGGEKTGFFFATDAVKYQNAAKQYL